MSTYERDTPLSPVEAAVVARFGLDRRPIPPDVIEAAAKVISPDAWDEFRWLGQAEAQWKARLLAQRIAPLIWNAALDVVKQIAVEEKDTWSMENAHPRIALDQVIAALAATRVED